MTHERPERAGTHTYTRQAMETGTLGYGRRPDLGALAEAKESVDRALGDLALAVLEAQERERTRLADELHDGPAQALSNLIMQSEVIERQLHSDPNEAVAELHRMRDLLRAELEGLRGYINQLRPPLSESDDLNAALTEAATRLTESTGVPVEVSLEAPPDVLDESAWPAVLRVAQEALRNIGKHAAARRAWVLTRLEQAGGSAPAWILEVGDDGHGFDIGSQDQQARRRHFGLRFMRERSELLGARLSIDSQPAAGTVVRLTVSQSGGGR